MTKAEIESAVRRVLSLALQREVPPQEFPSREMESDWDSLKQVELIFMLEEEFGLQFQEDDLPRLDSLRSIAVLVEEHLAAQNHH